MAIVPTPLAVMFWLSLASEDPVGEVEISTGAGATLLATE